MVPHPTDNTLPHKGKREGNLFAEGSPDGEGLRAWAERVWSGEPTVLVPQHIQRAVRERGIPYDSFETPQQFADRVMRWFDAHKDQTTKGVEKWHGTASTK